MNPPSTTLAVTLVFMASSEMMVISMRKWAVLCAISVLILTMYLWFYHSCEKNRMSAGFSNNGVYSVWPKFSVETVYTQEYFNEHCAEMSDMSMEKLHSFIKLWSESPKPECSDLYRRFSAIYSVSKRATPLILPKPFQEKVKGWLDNNDQLFQQVFKQEVTHIYNHLTHEYTIFNPLRDKRPVKKPEEPERKYVERLAELTKQSCDFCNFKDYTAEHEPHRLETSLSYTASNTFKLDKWHALFMMKQHHPLNWTREQFMDLMKISLDWFGLAHRHDYLAQYPVVVWDMFPHAGASQIHPHLHGLLSPNRYHGVVEQWRTAAEEYYRQFGTNYFTDLVSIYSSLGLAVRHGDAIAFANIVPKKDHEVVIVSPTAGESFYQLIYYTLRAYIDDIEKLSFSMGIGLPPMTSLGGSIPAYARIVTRGAVAEVRTDMSSLELFAGTNVNIDPYKVIRIVRSSINNRHKGSL